MSSEMMGPQLDPGQLPGVLDDDSCCCIGDRENPVLRLDGSFLQVRSQTICNFSRDEDDLSILAALWALDRQLVVADIFRGELQDLADSHPTSCHQLQDKPVSHLRRPENNLIDYLLFDNFPVCRLIWPVDLP
jgi:hypothetical protein